MRKTLLLSMVVMLLILPKTAPAQGTGGPNFSGTWKMNATKSRLPKASRIQSETLVIDQDGIQFTFHYDTDGKQSIENYTADKQEKLIREVPQAGSKIVSKAYWKGATFITETKAVFSRSSPLGASEMMNTRDSWTISADGRMLNRKSQWDDGQSLTVYDKQ